MPGTVNTDAHLSKNVSCLSVPTTHSMNAYNAETSHFENWICSFGFVVVVVVVFTICTIAAF